MSDHGYSPETLALLWPPAFERVAKAEGWCLYAAGGTHVEIDYDPLPDNHDGDPYYMLIQWIVLSAYVWLSDAHRVAWEFEFASNADIYLGRRVPGDSKPLPDDNDGWKRPFESDVRYSG